MKLTEQKMDLKDMLKYRVLLNQRVEQARSAGRTKVLHQLLEYCDVVDIVLDTIAASTIMEMAPQLPALTGRDFNLEILALAAPSEEVKNITNDTQITIEYEDVTDVEKPGTPAEKAETLVEKLNALLSKSFTKNIGAAVEIYLRNTGKKIFPADAWTEIKDMFPTNRLFPIWDKHIATQYRINGPIVAYAAVKKHLPNWDYIEIGRVCEDAVKRVIVMPSEPFTSAKLLEDMITSGIQKEKMKEWKAAPQATEVLNTYFKAALEGELAAAAKKEKLAKSALDILREKLCDKELGRIIACMVPETRNKMEAKTGRKPYVEMGY